MTTVVLLSGGMDSAACLLWAKRVNGNVEAMFVDYGQRAAMSENVTSRSIAERVGARFHYVKTAMVGGIAGTFDANDPGDCVVPARNIVLVSLAAGLVDARGGGSVVIGCCADDHAAFPDCRPATLEALGETLRLAGLRVSLAMPFVTFTKREIVDWAGRQEGGLDLLRSSVSCYLGTGCGGCHACRSRASGFEVQP